jgi:hypothetical protein
VIYVYAITDTLPRGLRSDGGFGGRPMRALEYGTLAGVFSPDPPHDLPPTEETLWHHEHVVEDLMRRGTVLPLRFGSTLPGVADLRELLRLRGDEFTAALDAVRGRVEMGVRATTPVAALPFPDQQGTGQAYLASKLARRRVAAELADEINREVEPLSRASTCKLLGDPQPMFAGAYLVDRDDVAGFRECCERARDAHPDVELTCTGPWPPFSFAEPMETA